MTLIVEDGTQVVGANSYDTLAGIRAYALARGVVLSADDAVVEPLAIKAMAHIEGHRERFRGDKVTYAQSLQWPRFGASIDGFQLLETDMPLELAQAQAELVIVQHNGTPLTIVGTQDAVLIKKEKVGPIETEYATGDNMAIFDVPIMPTVDTLMRVLTRSGGALVSVRV